MLVLIVGIALVAMGFFAGAALVLVPLGWASWAAGPSLWLLFPLFSLFGYVLVVVGLRQRDVVRASFALSSLLLMLGLAAAAGLMLSAASIVEPVGSTRSLWFVFAIAGLLGVLGTAPRGQGITAIGATGR